jgi:hypothetical protein
VKTLPFADRSEGALTILRSFEIGSFPQKSLKKIFFALYFMHSWGYSMASDLSMVTNPKKYRKK